MPDFKAVSSNKAYVFDNAIFVSPIDFVGLKNSAPWITQGPNDADVTTLSCRINRGQVMSVKYVPSHTPLLCLVCLPPDLEWDPPRPCGADGHAVGAVARRYTRVMWVLGGDGGIKTESGEQNKEQLHCEELGDKKAQRTKTMGGHTSTRWGGGGTVHGA